MCYRTVFSSVTMAHCNRNHLSSIHLRLVTLVKLFHSNLPVSNSILMCFLCESGKANVIWLMAKILIE